MLNSFSVENYKDTIPTVRASVPVEKLFVVSGKLNEIPVQVLLDDGCNTNIISKYVLGKHRSSFDIVQRSIQISHSDKHHSEKSEEIICNAPVEIEESAYESNFVVANCRYDVLLRMPWHKKSRVAKDYSKHFVPFPDEDNVEMTEVQVPMRFEEKKEFEVEDYDVKIEKVGVTEIRKILKKNNSKNIEVFKVVDDTNTSKPRVHFEAHPEMKEIVSEYQEVIRSELPTGLPPKREIDHEITTEDGTRQPHRPLYQLSPAGLKAAKEYIADLLKKGKIHPSKSPYDAPSFFVKEGNNPLRGVVDHRALNRVTKRNSSPLHRGDVMFDRLGNATKFSKLDLKTGFHQIRVTDEGVEKNAFNTKHGQFEYPVMPMGLCNAPGTFQSLMNSIFSDYIDDFMVIYMDDLLGYSKSVEDHMSHVRQVLQRLRENHL